MKFLRNERGYALLVVLLLVVLMLGVSATFMAGSMNHAKQEQTVDTSNQAVASAEMGTVYFKSDFEKELKVIKQEISDETHLALNELINCVQYPMGINCATEMDRKEWEKRIDKQVRDSYISKIMNKVQQLNSINSNVIMPFNMEDIHYKMETASATKEIEEINGEQVITSINVELDIRGTSNGVEKKLLAYLDVKVPITFLNPDEPRNVQTNVITIDEDLTYDKIFNLSTPKKTCSQLLEEVKAGDAIAPYECTSQPGETLQAFVNLIEDDHLDPKDFRVFTNDFSSFVCEKICNDVDYKGINVVVEANDAGSTNNMNNLVNANLIINGKLKVGNNLINLGKNGTKQTIVVKELEVGVNLKNLFYTNFLILGLDDSGDPPQKATLDWKNHIGIANYSNLCLDIDRINQADLDRLAMEVDIVDSSKIYYYTRYSTSFFALVDANKNDRLVDIKNEETNRWETHKMTDLYVQRESSYSNFLKNCGITLKNSKTTSINVSVPVPLNTEFDVEVKY